MRRAAKKAEKAADKADRAIEKLPNKRKLRAESQGAVSRKKKFRGEKIESGKPSRAKRIVTNAPVTAASGKIHHEVSKHEDENVGIEAAHKVEEAVEAGAHTASYVKYSGKMRAYKKADKLEKKSDKANIDALWQKQKAEHPQTSTNPFPVAAEAGNQKTVCSYKGRESRNRKCGCREQRSTGSGQDSEKVRKYRRKDDGLREEPSERNHLHSDICSPDYDSGRRIVLLLCFISGRRRCCDRFIIHGRR